jgi:hypothetical protein
VDIFNRSIWFSNVETWGFLATTITIQACGCPSENFEFINLNCNLRDNFEFINLNCNLRDNEEGTPCIHNARRRPSNGLKKQLIRGFRG